MPNGVRFDEDTSFDPIPQPKLTPQTISTDLIAKGIVDKPNDARFIVLLISIALLGASYYLVAASLPESRVLGDDVLLQGEVVPEYVGK